MKRVEQARASGPLGLPRPTLYYLPLGQVTPLTAPALRPARLTQMHNEYTQLPSAEAVELQRSRGKELLAAASAASTFGSHDPYGSHSIAPYQPHAGSPALQPHEGSHSHSYEPVQAVVEAMAEHGAASSSAYPAHQATRKRGRPPGSKNKPHVRPLC